MSAKIDIKNLQEKAAKAHLVNIQVHTFMTTKVATVQEGISIRATIEILKTNRISSVPVVDINNHLLGIISERDLLIQAASYPLNSPIKYNKKVISVFPTTIMKEIITLLYNKRIKSLPVINKNHTLVGVVSRIDALNKLVTSS